MCPLPRRLEQHSPPAPCVHKRFPDASPAHIVCCLLPCPPLCCADLRGAQKLHSAACLAGMAVFAVEDASVPHVPLVHASWHALSALSTSLVNTVLADVEQQFPELTLDALTLPEDKQQQQRKQQPKQQWQQRGADAPSGCRAVVPVGCPHRTP